MERPQCSTPVTVTQAPHDPRIRCRIHWVTLTQTNAPKHDRTADLRQLAPEVTDWEERAGWLGYARHLRSPSTSAVIAYDMPGTNRAGYATLVLPGNALELIQTEQLFARYRRLTTQGALLTWRRLDIAVDVPHDILTPEHIYDAARTEVEMADDPTMPDPRGRFCNTHAHIDASLPHYNDPRALAEDGRRGTSGVYIGKRSSGRMLRAYDEHGPTRIEMETHAEWADEIGALLALDTEHHRPDIIGLIRDFIDLPDCGPWLQVMATAPRLSLQAMTTIKRTAKEVIDRKLRWLHHSVAPTLALVARALQDTGRAIATELYLHGAHKLTERDQDTIALVRDLIRAGLHDYPRDTARGLPLPQTCPIS